MSAEEDVEKGLARRSNDIDAMLKSADDRETRELLILLKDLSIGVQTAIKTGTINNEMTLRGNTALQTHIEQFNKFKDEEFASLKTQIMSKEMERRGFVGAVNKFSKPIAIVIWALTCTIFTWGYSRISETSVALTTHLAVSDVLDKKRDEVDRHLATEVDSIGTKMAIMIDQHSRAQK